jgi:hypothetical protein
MDIDKPRRRHFFSSKQREMFNFWCILVCRYLDRITRVGFKAEQKRAYTKQMVICCVASDFVPCCNFISTYFSYIIETPIT